MREYVGRSFDSAAWWWTWKMQLWERWRFQRLLRRHASIAVLQADYLGRQLAADQPLSLTTLPDLDLNPMAYYRTLLQHAFLQPHGPGEFRGGFPLTVFHEFVARAEAFRATILRLALSDFHREHGRYPDSLEDLVPIYFREVPRDPQSNDSFVYFPRGINKDVIGIHQTVRVNKDVPFLMALVVGNPLNLRPSENGTWDSGKARFTSEAVLSMGENVTKIWPVEPPK